MDNTTEQAPMTFIPMEQAICLRCQTEVRQEFIVRQIQKTPVIDKTRQTVRAWCEHCKLMFQCMRVLRDGYWQVVGNVEIVTDEKRRKQFLRRIDHNRNVIHRTRSQKSEALR